MIDYTCPNCEKNLQIPKQYKGHMAICKHCGNRFMVHPRQCHETRRSRREGHVGLAVSSAVTQWLFSAAGVVGAYVWGQTGELQMGVLAAFLVCFILLPVGHVVRGLKWESS